MKQIVEVLVLSEDGCNILNDNKVKQTCFGCEHLVVKDIWRGMYTASCGNTDGLIIPHSWSGNTVVITGIGEFCSGKSTKTKRNDNERP